MPEFEALRDAARGHQGAYRSLISTSTSKPTRPKFKPPAARCITPARADAANALVLDICRRHGAKSVAKGKSMIGEEMGLNAVLEAEGIVPVETDLGEYIIQLRHETPSHIIAPAGPSWTKGQVAEDFRRVHTACRPTAI